MTLRPPRSTTTVSGPRSNSEALSTPAIRPSTTITSFASGWLGSSVVMRPLWRMRWAIVFMVRVSRVKPRARELHEQWHGAPREDRDDASGDDAGGKDTREVRAEQWQEDRRDEHADRPHCNP